MRKFFIIFAVVISVGLLGAGVYWFIFRNKSNDLVQKTSNNTSKTTGESSNGFDKNKYSTTDPESIWAVVNKKNPLNPKTYEPANLAVPSVPLRLAKSSEQMQFSSQAIPALEEMFAAAKSEGVNLVFGSGYRSYALQKQFYESYLAKDGQAAADRYSARPGHSEHQTGLAVDFTRSDGKCHLQQCFESTEQGKWLAANAYKFGFIIRYTADNEAVAGYLYEPWHFRYVGKALAAEMQKQGITTLEEFFGLGAATSY